MALDGRAPISTHAHLREACDRACQLLRLLPGATLGREVLAQADAQALLRRHLSPGEDDLEGAALADEARQPHRAAVDQGHAPAAAVNAEIGLLRHHPEVAPQAELHAAGDRRALNRGDHRLVELQREGPSGPRGISPPLPRGRAVGMSSSPSGYLAFSVLAYLRSHPAQNAPPAP